jgi:hypothetical protein
VSGCSTSFTLTGQLALDQDGDWRAAAMVGVGSTLYDDSQGSTTTFSLDAVGGMDDDVVRFGSAYQYTSQRDDAALGWGYGGRLYASYDPRDEVAGGGSDLALFAVRGRHGEKPAGYFTAPSAWLVHVGPFGQVSWRRPHDDDLDQRERGARVGLELGLRYMLGSD